MLHFVRSKGKTATAILGVNIALSVSCRVSVIAPFMTAAFLGTYFDSLVVGGVEWLRRPKTKRELRRVADRPGDWLDSAGSAQNCGRSCRRVYKSVTKTTTFVSGKLPSFAGWGLWSILSAKSWTKRRPFASFPDSTAIPA